MPTQRTSLRLHGRLRGQKQRKKLLLSTRLDFKHAWSLRLVIFRTRINVNCCNKNKIIILDAKQRFWNIKASCNQGQITRYVKYAMAWGPRAKGPRWRQELFFYTSIRLVTVTLYTLFFFKNLNYFIFWFNWYKIYCALNGSLLLLKLKLNNAIMVLFIAVFSDEMLQKVYNSWTLPDRNCDYSPASLA